MDRHRIGPFEPFTVRLDVTIRLCRREDLPTLEWFGLFTPHRQMIQSTFERQERGEAVMLIAEANGVPSGQVWIDLARGEVDSTGVLWAVRVFPCLQNLGIGTRLIAASEKTLAARGFRFVELTVEKDNPGARRLYERLGYRHVGDVRGAYDSATPEQVPVRRPIDQWVMRKTLRSQDLEERAHPAAAKEDA